MMNALKIAKLTASEKNRDKYAGFWVFNRRFFADGHGTWTSKKTILTGRRAPGHGGEHVIMSILHAWAETRIDSMQRDALDRCIYADHSTDARLLGPYRERRPRVLASRALASRRDL